LNDFDEPVVVDLRWSAMFAARGALLTAAGLAGYAPSDLLRRILSAAEQRHAGLPPLSAVREATGAAGRDPSSAPT
jgi:hypothetical protein